MARPHKMNVDYFPHFCSPGSRTLHILERKYGNDGYAFWFKLLELLGNSAGLFYDFNDTQDWEFLVSKMNMDEELAKEILQTVINLHAIDEELAGKKILWCQNLVKNVAGLFQRRNQPLPTKPGEEPAEPQEEKPSTPLPKPKHEPEKREPKGTKDDPFEDGSYYVEGIRVGPMQDERFVVLTTKKKDPNQYGLMTPQEDKELDEIKERRKKHNEELRKEREKE